MIFRSPGAYVRKARKPRRGPPSQTEVANRITAVGDKSARQVKETIVSGINAFKGTLKDRDFSSRDYKKIVDKLPWDKLPQHMKDAFTPLVGAGEKAGRVSLEALPPNPNVNLRYDLKNPAIADYVGNRSAALIVESTQETKGFVRGLVREAINQGIGPAGIAQRVRGVVGLTTRQAAGVEAHRRGLESQGLPKAQVEARATAYEERALDRRALTIGITESRFAVNYGQQAVWDEAVAQDYLPTNAKKRWMVEDDPCDVCRAADGQTVDIGDAFELSDGQALQAPPAHPLCKCSVTLELDDV